jgi:hypothetical protein
VRAERLGRLLSLLSSCEATRSDALGSLVRGSSSYLAPTAAAAERLAIAIGITSLGPRQSAAIRSECRSVVEASDLARATGYTRVWGRFVEAARPSGHLPHRPCAGPSDLAASCLTRCRPRGRLRQFGGRHVGGARGGGHRPPAPSCGRWWRPTRQMFGQWRWRLPDASLLGHLSKPKLPRRGAVAGARGPLRTSLRGESVFLHRRPTQWSLVAQGGDAETA